MSLDDYKRVAAQRAVDEVCPGMMVGLGTGSTARHFVELLGQRVREGLRIQAVPTSEDTRRQALECGISLADADLVSSLDLTVDGADEIGPDLSLIKGGGGALLREKIIASASQRMIVIADYSKVVSHLGCFPLPIEVVPFGLAATETALHRAFHFCGCSGDILMREGFVTDGGHWILDAHLSRIDEPERLSQALSSIPGVVEHGLFLGLATQALIAGPQGLEIRQRERG